MSNYYLPAEWQPQYAVQLTWPHNATLWQKKGLLTAINQYFVNLAQNILKYQKLIIIAHDKKHQEFIESELGSGHNYNFEFFICPSDDTWARDHGPITLINSKEPKNSSMRKITLDFDFNAWGEKYEFKLDDQLTQNLYGQSAYINSQYQKINYILEGGSIDCDGQGTVLTTASCLLNKNRNPQLTSQEIPAKLKKYLNINKLIILKNSLLYGDDTDGHIDMIARFTSPDTIVYAACDNQDNPNYNNLLNLKLELASLQETGELNPNIQLIPLFIPEMQYSNANDKSIGNLLPASYVNFLIINKAVLVPTYNDNKYDMLALDTFRQLFPNRDIIGINSQVAIKQGGSLHCLTMHIPE